MENEEALREAMANWYESTRLVDFAIDRSLEDIARGETPFNEESEANEDSEDEAETAIVGDRAPNCTEIVPLDETREALRVHSQEKIHEVLRNALFSDPYIQD
ncbi:unnamed protein product [Mortierella alpina]